eukprot:CAMPEP_0172386640 /NCGR_PEP_ID=MMETSP1061-20121228/4113_1 /TAXON_ID=37318 /ORGANISM="Pseudo-nitzschia pungens, Strain cf. pungens" /LENGTH=228 /DNA_ID=CAMNT_0013116045 /DNA_START=139 /DNA_END=825 /DNA_ORIENTATION=+
MAHKSIQFAGRGFGLAAQHFRATNASSSAVRSVATTIASALGNPSAERPNISISMSTNANANANANAISMTTQNHNFQRSSYSSTTATHRREYKPNPLDAFRDPVDRSTRMEQPVGRQWSVKELRRKSYEDLHRLWYVLYKEKNMLLTERQLSRRRQLIFPQPGRFQKVQKSMGAIRQVLGERKRETVAAHLARQQEKEPESELAKQMTAESETQVTYEDATDETATK